MVCIPRLLRFVICDVFVHCGVCVCGGGGGGRVQYVYQCGFVFASVLLTSRSVQVLSNGYRPGHLNVPQNAWGKMAEMFSSLAQELPPEESSGSDDS